MLHPETHLVTRDHGPRPAGKPDECFYCNQKIGEAHKADCVMRSRTVVVRVTTEYVVDVPEAWSESDIESHRGESSWCAFNGLVEISEMVARVSADDAPEGVDSCRCWFTSYEYVREATEDDEQRDAFTLRLG